MNRNVLFKKNRPIDGNKYTLLSLHVLKLQVAPSFEIVHKYIERNNKWIDQCILSVYRNKFTNDINQARNFLK